MSNPLPSLPFAVQTFGLLALSNVFMTIAWYGHLKNLADRPRSSSVPDAGAAYNPDCDKPVTDR